MKIIDLLNKIANGEYMPDYMSYFDLIENRLNTMNVSKSNIIHKLDIGALYLNSEITLLEDEDIPLIPDDELHIFKGDCKELNYNFKVLKEKVNQVVSELNNTMKEVSNLIKK